MPRRSSRLLPLLLAALLAATSAAAQHAHDTGSAIDSDRAVPGLRPLSADPDTTSDNTLGTSPGRPNSAGPSRPLPGSMSPAPAYTQPSVVPLAPTTPAAPAATPPPPGNANAIEIAALLRTSGSAALAPLYPGSVDGFVAALALRGYTSQPAIDLPALGAAMIVFTLPPGADADAIVAQLRADFPTVAFDRNGTFDAAQAPPLRYALDAMGAGTPTGPACASPPAGTRFGMIDTPALTGHPALASLVIHQWQPPGKTAQRAGDHGTAIAGILAEPGIAAGASSTATLYLAGVLEPNDEGARAAADRVVFGLDWLASHHVDIAVMAIAGQANATVDLALLAAADTGMLMVAAAGNVGPESPVAFPASSRWVFAITAVDADGAPYRRAARGRAVLFAAPGVEVWAPDADGAGRYFTGTSLATPFAALALAQLLPDWPREARTGTGALTVRTKLARMLAAGAIDLGAPGRDPVFGWGLLRFASCPDKQP